MTLAEIIKTRYTERKYSNKPVEDEKIKQILESGRLAPTAKNNQPQKIYVVKSTSAMERIRQITPCHYNAPLAMIICYDKNLEWHNPADNKVASGIEDASIVATHMLLQATELGVHTTWVNMFMPDEVKAEFDLPKNETPVLLMMFGYPSASSAPSAWHIEKKALSETVKFL